MPKIRYLSLNIIKNTIYTILPIEYDRQLKNIEE